MSRTSDCDPNEIASPNTPAPAISGAVSTPRCDSTISDRDHRDHHPERGAQHRQHGLQARAGRGPRRRRRAAAGRDRHPGDAGRSPCASASQAMAATNSVPTAMPIDCIARALCSAGQFEGVDPDPGEREQRGEPDRARAGCGAPRAPSAGPCRQRRVRERAGHDRASRARSAARRRAGPGPPPGSISRRGSTTAGRATGRTRRTAAAGQCAQNAIGSQQAGQRGAQRAEQTAAVAADQGLRHLAGAARRSAHTARIPARRRSAR